MPWKVIHPAPGSGNLASLRIAGQRFVHCRTGAEVKEVRRHPDMALRPRPDAVEDRCVYGAGVLAHDSVRKLHCFSDESKPMPIFYSETGYLLGGKNGARE
jgi:hypothetical protein